MLGNESREWGMKILITKIVFLIVLIAINAFFAASEIALISLNDNKMKLMAEEGDKKALQLMKLLGEPGRFLATIQIGITLAGFLASAFAAESFADPVVKILMGFSLPFSESLLRVATVIVITVILAYFTLVLGELVPKRVAMKKSEGIAFFVVTPLTILSKVANPFVKLLTVSTNFFVRLFGIDPNSTDEAVTEEEIRMMVDVGQEKGTINEREKIMINNIFEFNDKTAGDVMTHRVELIGIPYNVEWRALIDFIKYEHYSRYPVYDENIDNIIGIFHVKDLLKFISEDKADPFRLVSLIRKPIYVPKKEKIDKLFVDLQVAKTHIAIVLDEYGGTAGIVTLEDLVEEIVGDIFDEYDKDEDKEFMQIDETTYEASGMISLYELEGYLNAELPVQEYDTLNGFLVSLFGAMPPKDKISEVKFKKLLFQAIEVTDKRIVKVVIKVGE